MVRPVPPSSCALAASAGGTVPAIVARGLPASASSAIASIPARSASTSARARHLLESSDLSVDRIAGEVGFATGASLRQHLHAATQGGPACR